MAGHGCVSHVLGNIQKINEIQQYGKRFDF